MEEKTNAMRRPDYGAEIAEIVRERLNPRLTYQRLMDYHPNDIAAAIGLLSPRERERLASALGLPALAEVLEYADPLSEYLAPLPLPRRAALLAQMEAPSAARYLEELDDEEREALLALMADDSREELSLLASFDRELIGSRMETGFVTVREGMGVREAMNELVRQAADSGNVSTLYVLDGEERFVGAIDLRDLIVARASTPLDSITVTAYPYVYASEEINAVISYLSDYSEDSIPVLDSENRLCGLLTAETLAELTRDEMGDDYAKLGGLSAEEESDEPIRRSVGKRLPWLAVLFALGLLVSGVVGVFESVVASLTLIVSFQSLILGMAGNAGTQSLAVTVRRLSSEELTVRRELSLVWREVRLSALNGLFLGALSFVAVGAYLALLRGESLSLAFSVSLCTGIALVVSMMLSGLAGVSVPLIFRRLGIDPAVASGPFITTASDLVAVVTYYGLAYLLLLTR